MKTTTPRDLEHLSLERSWVTKTHATTTTEQFVAGVADVLVASAERADALVLAAFEGARSDQRLAALAAQLKANGRRAGWCDRV